MLFPASDLYKAFLLLCKMKIYGCFALLHKQYMFKNEVKLRGFNIFQLNCHATQVRGTDFKFIKNKYLISSSQFIFD